MYKKYSEYSFSFVSFCVGISGKTFCARSERALSADKINLNSLSGMSKKFNVGNVFIENKFDICESLSVKFDIFRKIVDRIV